MYPRGFPFLAFGGAANKKIRQQTSFLLGRMLPYPWCHLNYRHSVPVTLCALPVESTAAITSGARLPLLLRMQVQGAAHGCSSGFVFCAVSSTPRSLQEKPEALLFPVNAFIVCIVSRVFVRVNTAGAFFCRLFFRCGRCRVLRAMTAQPVQHTALALQGKAVLCHQVSAHLIHKMAVQVIDAPALLSLIHI